MWLPGWLKNAEQVHIHLPINGQPIVERKRPQDLDLIAEPRDLRRPDTSAVFQSLRNVQTLPHLRPVRRLRSMRNKRRAGHKSRRMGRLMDLARSLAFWKAG